MMSDDQDSGFLEHLGELRTRLIRAVAAMALGFVVAYIFHRQLLAFLVRPVMYGLRDHGVYALQTLSITEGIMTYIKAAMVAGLAISMPWVLREIWLFIAPGLTDQERQVVLPALFVVFLFFLSGMMFSYLFFVPFVVDFLAGMTPNHALLVPRLSDVLSLSLMFYIVFGVIFEVPLVMFILSFLGIFKVSQYVRFSKYFVVTAFIIGALFTPPDPLSQVLLAVPLCALYALGILASLATGSTSRPGSALRVLGAMALLLILLSLTGYFVAKSARQTWIKAPLAHLRAGECLMFTDLNAIGTQGCNHTTKGYQIALAQGRTKTRLITGLANCPASMSAFHKACLCKGSQIDEKNQWLTNLRPVVPAGIWCKKGDLKVLVSPAGSGFRVIAQGKDKALINAVRQAFTDKDWPMDVTDSRNSGTRTVFWLPKPGFAGFLSRLYTGLSGL